MAVSLSPFAGAGWQFLDATGAPLENGFVHTYAVGSTTPLAAYTSSAGSQANTNPIQLNASGRPTYSGAEVEIWLTTTSVYKFVVTDANGANARTFDNIPGIASASDLAAYEALIASSTGSSLVGYIQAGTGAVARTVQSRLREVVSVFDFIPVAQQAAIVAGTTTYDATADIQNAINQVKAVKGTLYFPGGTYLVSLITFNGTGYTVDTSSGVTFKQVTGLSDGNEHPIVLVDQADDLTIGDLNLLGNISSDLYEYNHGMLVRKCKQIRIGALYGTNIRGDVLYCSGRTSSDRERLDGIYIASVSGTNIFRSLVAVVGGNVQIGAIINDGPVGYRDLDVEPNAGGSFQASQVDIGTIIGGGVQVTSGDPAFQNDRFSCDTMDLDWTRIVNSTPPYSSFPGTNAFAFAFAYCASGYIGLLKLRNYKSYPVSLASSWDSLVIDDFDVANCNQTETTFNSIIVQQGTPGNGLLDISYVKCVHTANTKWFVRSNNAGLKCRIGSGVISGGLLSQYTVLDIGSLVLDAGSSTGIIIGAASLSTIGNLSVTNAGSATLLAGSSNCNFTGFTGTVGTLVTLTSNNNTFDNSVINGAAINGQIVSSDTPATVTAAATITLPLDLDTVVVTGNTGITSITPDPFAIRRVVILQFTGTPTVTDGSNLKLNGNFVASADDTLSLFGDGVNWYEVARSAN